MHVDYDKFKYAVYNTGISMRELSCLKSAHGGHLVGFERFYLSKNLCKNELFSSQYQSNVPEVNTIVNSPPRRETLQQI